MSPRLCLVLALASGCAATHTPSARAPGSMFDVSRICDDPHYRSICEETQAPSTFPPSAPIRIDTNLEAQPRTKLARR